MGNYRPVAVDMHAFKRPRMMSRIRASSRPAGRQRRQRDFNPREAVTSGPVSMEDAVKNPTAVGGQPNAEDEYPAMEQYYKGHRRRAGHGPRAGPGRGWVGNGPLTGLKTDDSDRRSSWQNRINNTAMRMGKSPQEVEQGFWRASTRCWPAAARPAR